MLFLLKENINVPSQTMSRPRIGRVDPISISIPLLVISPLLSLMLPVPMTLGSDTLAIRSSEWRRYTFLSGEIAEFRCSTMEEISARARFILSDHNLVGMLATSTTEGAIRGFLASMVLSVDNVDIGEN